MYLGRSDCTLQGEIANIKKRGVFFGLKFKRIQYVLFRKKGLDFQKGSPEALQKPDSRKSRGKGREALLSAWGPLAWIYSRAEAEAEARRGAGQGGEGNENKWKRGEKGRGRNGGCFHSTRGKGGKEEEKPFGELERDGWGKGRKRAYCSSLPSFSVDGSPSWRRTIYANILLLLLLHPGYHIIRPEWRRGKFVGTSGKTNPRRPNAAKAEKT